MFWMSSQAAFAKDALPDDAPSAAQDFARPSFEVKKAQLERLAAIGMEIAESLGRLAADTPLLQEPGEVLTIKPAEIILGFNRIGRCVRLTHALHSEVVEELRRIDRIEAGAAVEARSRRSAASQAREHTVRSVLTRIIHAEALGPEDDAAKTGEARTGKAEGDEADSDVSGERETCERLIGEAREYLKDRERFGDLIGRPLSDIIGHICRDLGITPDWLSLSEESWAQEERRSGVVGEALQKVLHPQNIHHPGGGRDPGVFRSRTVRPGTVPRNPATEKKPGSRPPPG